MAIKMSKVLIDRELLERAASMELDTTARSIRIQDELRAILAQPAQPGEAVEVVGMRIRTDGFGSYIADFAMGVPAAMPGEVREQLMTVAQHQRIMAALADNSGKPNLSAGCKVVPVELLELLREMVDLHDRRGTVLTVHMEQLRAILEAKDE